MILIKVVVSWDLSIVQNTNTLDSELFLGFGFFLLGLPPGFLPSSKGGKGFPKIYTFYFKGKIKRPD